MPTALARPWPGGPGSGCPTPGSASGRRATARTRRGTAGCTGSGWNDRRTARNGPGRASSGRRGRGGARSGTAGRPPGPGSWRCRGDPSLLSAPHPWPGPGPGPRRAGRHRSTPGWPGLQPGYLMCCSLRDQAPLMGSARACPRPGTRNPIPSFASFPDRPRGPEGLRDRRAQGRRIIAVVAGTLPAMATPMPGFDPRAVIEGRPPGRPRTGLILGIIAAIGCGIVVLGADALQSVDAAGHSVAPFLIALPFALLPVPFLVGCVLLLDRLEPEPRANLVLAFAWGAGIAALVAAVINTAGLLYITQPDLGKTTGQYISATFGAPVVEESLKGLVLIVLLWRRRQELDGPTDGIIYAAMVGLGFAMTENLGYYLDALVRPEVGGVKLLGMTFVLRGVLSPFAHPIFTSMTGIGVAYAATHRHGRWAIGVGLLAAMFLHGMWNALTALGLIGLAIAYPVLACVFIGLI